MDVKKIKIKFLYEEKKLIKIVINFFKLKTVNMSCDEYLYKIIGLKEKENYKLKDKISELRDEINNLKKQLRDFYDAEEEEKQKQSKKRKLKEMKTPIVGSKYDIKILHSIYFFIRNQKRFPERDDLLELLSNEEDLIHLYEDYFKLYGYLYEPLTRYCNDTITVIENFIDTNEVKKMSVKVIIQIQSLIYIDRFDIEYMAKAYIKSQRQGRKN